MKHSLKISLTALVGLTLIYAGCKKSDITAIDNQPQISQKDVAQKIAMQIYTSLSSQLNGGGLTTVGKSGLTTMESGGGCGALTITPTNKTFTSGDTTFTLKGNSIFRLTCTEVDGKIPSRPNGYTLDDTLNKTEAGKKFLNTFNNSINYIVSDQGGFAFSLTGKSYAYAKFATPYNNKDDVKEYHDFSTRYDMQILGSSATSNSAAVFSAGQIIFECTQEDFYKEESKRNASYKYSGYMLLSRDVITSYFHHGVNEMVKYEIDVKTGKIISGPTVVK